MRTNILLELTVVLDGYSGDYKTAINEAYALSKELNIGCRLNYANQYVFVILPTMSVLDINRMKNRHIIIGV